MSLSSGRRNDFSLWSQKGRGGRCRLRTLCTQQFQWGALRTERNSNGSLLGAPQGTLSLAQEAGVCSSSLVFGPHLHKMPRSFSTPSLWECTNLTTPPLCKLCSPWAFLQELFMFFPDLSCALGAVGGLSEMNELSPGAASTDQTINQLLVSDPSQ